MHQRRAGLAQAGALAAGQVDGVTVKTALAEQAVSFVRVEIISRLGVEAQHPVDFVCLLGQMGLHQAIGVFGPERAQRVELGGRRGRREAWGDGVGQPVYPMPAPDQRAAVVIGRLRGVAQPLGRGVAIHAGLAGRQPHAAPLRLGKERVGAGGVNGAVRADGRRAVRRHQIEVERGDVRGIGRIGKAHFFGEGICVQPVDQPLAPAGDDRGLGIVGVGVDKAGQDDPVSVIDEFCPRMGRAQDVARAGGLDHSAGDRHRLFHARRACGVAIEGRAVEAEDAPRQDHRFAHLPASDCPL